jgi:Glycosyltransferase WbsX
MVAISKSNSNNTTTTPSKRTITLSSVIIFFTLLLICQHVLIASTRASRRDEQSNGTRSGHGESSSSSPLSSLTRSSSSSSSSNSHHRLQHLSLPRVLAIYFPQYHPDPLNDRNWGKNFTDWNSLRAAPAKNRYGFSIPRPTDELGYYDLRDTWVRKRQGELARMHGIDGFIIHHYWFYDVTHPGPSLHAPLLAMLQDGEPNVSFFLNWCGERWTNVWMGRPLFQTIPTSKNRAITLQEQYFNATHEMIQEHYAWLKQFFVLDNYIRIHGQPVLMIYQWHDEIKPILETLRRLAIADGFPGLFLASGRSGSHADLFPIHNETLDEVMRGVIRRKTNPLDLFPMDVINKTIAYPYPLPWVNTSLSLPDWCTHQNRHGEKNVPISLASRESPGVVPCFDNTPRREYKFSTIWNADMEPDQVLQRFAKSMLAAIRFDACCLAFRNSEYAALQDRFVVVNAWNEWAEGMSLEPSDVYGTRLLQAIQNVKKKVLQEGCSTQVLLSSAPSTS